jgi:fibronectin type 3 domain-containing protein
MNKKLVVLIPGVFLLATQLLNAADVRFRATVHSKFVLLSWDTVRDAQAFNIYRIEPGGTYLKLNAAPIVPLGDCAEIEKVIPHHSLEARAISRVLDITACEINQRKRGARDSWYKAREGLTLRHYKIAVVRGLAYQDSTVIVGQTYRYQLRSVPAGREKILASDLEVRAGVVVPLPPPTGVTALAGDAQVFVSWNPVDSSIFYHVLRATAPGASFLPITPSGGVAGAFKFNPITTDSLIPPRPGYVDTLCTNNTTYYYRVQCADLLGQLGDSSVTASATPRDKTSPRVPAGVYVQPLVYGLQLTWTRVDTDIAGRHEHVLGYTITRYPKYGSAVKDSSGSEVGYVNQPDSSITNVNFKDTLITPNTTYWYRIRCEDDAIPVHNVSGTSAAVSGFYKDPYPPGRPTGLTTNAFEDSIILHWTPPKDSDLAGFNIYRGICGCETVYVYRRRDVKTALLTTLEVTKGKAVAAGWSFVSAYCRPYTLALIANIDSVGACAYADRSVPKGSPICYRYAINAYDTTQNLSVMSDSVCDRLKDRTGPTAPIIAGLQARDRAVLVEWVQSPIQDLFGFIVERAGDPNGPWIQVSPSLHLPDPASIGCKEISATNAWADSTFSYLDTSGVREKTKYWYRVKAVDYMGNAGSASPEIGTFAFDRHLPEMPANVQTSSGGKCIVRVTWDPGYDSTQLGFAVFRSKAPGSGYHQVSPIVRGNSFDDRQVASGETYYYRVQYYARNGNRSLSSAARSHTVQ